MARQLAGPVFRAHTIECSPSAESSSLITRPRLESLFQKQSWIGNNIVISGPAGSGKTMLALAATIRNYGSVQYIGARSIPVESAFEISAPEAGAARIADMLNLFARANRSESLAQTQKFLDEIVKLRLDSQTVLILDDLDLIPPNSLGEYSDLVSERVRLLSDNTMIMVTRSSYDGIIEFVGNQVHTRVISPQLLLITPDELKDLVDHHSLGDLSAKEIVRVQYLWPLK